MSTRWKKQTYSQFQVKQIEEEQDPPAARKVNHVTFVLVIETMAINGQLTPNSVKDVAQLATIEHVAQPVHEPLGSSCGGYGGVDS